MALRYWNTSSTKRILTTESEWSKKRRSCWDRHNRFPKVRITIAYDNPKPEPPCGQTEVGAFSQVISFTWRRAWLTDHDWPCHLILVPLQLELRDFRNPWCPPVVQSSQLCFCTQWSGSAATPRSARLTRRPGRQLGRSWKKGQVSAIFGGFQFFVVSSFSHGEEMLLQSRSDCTTIVPVLYIPYIYIYVYI